MKRVLLIALFAVSAAFLPASSADAEVLGEYGVPRSGRICIEDNGYTSYNDTLPLLVNRLHDHGITNVVVWDECNGPGGPMSGNDTVDRPVVYNRLDHVIDIVYANSPSEDYCARTERTWNWDGNKWIVASTNIRLNLAFFQGCRSTAFERRHVMFHEVGHAYSLTHEDGPGVMTTWAYGEYTPADYAHLRRAGYTDLN